MQDILDKILTKVIDIEERLDSFATKKKLRLGVNNVLNFVDRFIGKKLWSTTI